MTINRDIEIIKNLSGFLSGLALSTSSFAAIAGIIWLGSPDGNIVIQGNKLHLSPTIFLMTVFLSFSLLIMSCLVLFLLGFIDE